jgi:hypothetical protein
VPIASSELIAALRPVLADLTADLLERSLDDRVNSALQAAWQRERDEKRTADPFDVWARQRVGQVAAAWVLSVLFVRVLEVRGLVERNRIAGEGATDSWDQFVRIAPFLNQRDYLLTVFRELSSLEGARHLFAPGSNPLWQLGPSGEAAQRLIDAFQATDADGRPVIDLADADPRLLGDVYQDLNEEVRARYALLQTPQFVEDLILDETLTPAIKERGVAEVKLIDPACGSGHFLLGAFRRLLAAWREAEPATEAKELARRALGQVAGVDINPYAVAISRFRLTLAFLEAAEYQRLSEAPQLEIRVAVADSLLQQPMLSLPGFGSEPTPFELDDRRLAAELLCKDDWAVVVGNPPYINVKDAALRSTYRKLFTACYRGYQLVAPFLELFFQIAEKPEEGAQRGGYVGAIVGNGFMKREFGRKLIEEVLPKQELTHVIDTSGAYIPGHGTPTVILFGRRWSNPEQPSKAPVLAVMGKRGEPVTPDDPANGKVWSAVRNHHRTIGYEDEYISVAEVDRKRFRTHPWSLGGGGAAELKQQLEKVTKSTLGKISDEIGFICITRADEVYFAPPGSLKRRGVKPEHIVQNVEGERIRDWSIVDPNETVFPYDSNLAPIDEVAGAAVHRYLWPYREILWRRREPNGDQFTAGNDISDFANQGGAPRDNRSAPVIKLKPEATEDDHFALLAYLNSSTACFWMKQVMMPKGATSHKGVLQGDPEKFRFEFDGTKLAKLPVPDLTNQKDRSPLLELARLLDSGGRSLAEPVFVSAIQRYSPEGRDELTKQLDRLEAERELLRGRMVAWQEELDWLVYELVGFEGIDGENKSLALIGSADSLPGMDPDTRAYRFIGDDEAFPPDRVGRARLQAIRSGGDLALIERPEHKRRWFRSRGKFDAENVTDSVLRHEALTSYLLNRLEQVFADTDAHQIQARTGNHQITTTRQLAATLQSDSAVNTVAELLTGESSPNLELLFAELIGSDTVPYLAAYRYSDSGMEKRAAWEQTWVLQRLEDEYERRLKEHGYEANDDDIEVPVPPRYTSKDFRSPVYWRHRGKLDVPKERFISYPDAASDDDGANTIVLGWAGWDHRQQATALAELYQRRKRDDGWGAERLMPMLAGINELVPWLKQWHNEPDPIYGQRLGDEYATYVETEAHSLGISVDDLKKWRPAKKTRGLSTRRKSSGKGRRPTLTPDDLLAAIDRLSDESGVEQRQLAEELGVSGATVARVADQLVAEGRLVVVSGRPKRFQLAGGDAS